METLRKHCITTTSTAHVVIIIDPNSLGIEHNMSNHSIKFSLKSRQGVSAVVLSKKLINVRDQVVYSFLNRIKTRGQNLLP